MLKLLQKFIVVVFLLVFSTCLFAVAGEPDAIDSEIKENSSQTNENATLLDQPVETIDTFSLESSVNQAVQERSKFPDDVIDNLDQYDRLLKQKQFIKANQVLKAIPRSFMTEEQLHQQRMLDVFDSIIQDQKENEAESQVRGHCDGILSAARSELVTLRLDPPRLSRLEIPHHFFCE